jgi:hypothetical protein
VHQPLDAQALRQELNHKSHCPVLRPLRSSLQLRMANDLLRKEHTKLKGYAAKSGQINCRRPRPAMSVAITLLVALR